MCLGLNGIISRLHILRYQNSRLIHYFLSLVGDDRISGNLYQVGAPVLASDGFFQCQNCDGFFQILARSVFVYTLKIVIFGLFNYNSNA